MKKVITFFTVVFSLLTMHAQYVKVEPGNFTNVQISGNIKVVLIPSNKSMVEVSGISAEKVEILNKAGKLTLKLAPSTLGKEESAEANIYFKSLEVIQADNGSSIVCTSPIESFSLNVVLKDKSDIYLYIKTINTTVDLSKNCVLKLIGDTDNYTVNMKENCELKSRDLNAKKTTITLDGDGTAQVSAIDSINAKVLSSGSIFVYGEPKSVTEKAEGSGTITMVK